jgi:ketosteroid isomerase-like protein
MNSSETFIQFVTAINAHDPEALHSLMTANHRFIDSLNNRVEGAETMRNGWRGYFAMCPDYRIEVAVLLDSDNIVLATGTAEGTIDDTPWKIPAAWRAVIRDGLVAEWQVFADNKPVYEILARRAR